MNIVSPSSVIFSKEAFPKGRYDNGDWSINILNEYTVLFMGSISNYELNLKEILETGLDFLLLLFIFLSCFRISIIYLEI